MQNSVKEIKLNTNHELKFQNEQTEICELCDTPQYIMKLNCEHFFCRSCLKSHCFKRTSDTLKGKITCPRCPVDIPSNMVYRIFGSTKKVDQIKAQAGYKPKKIFFFCEICFNQQPIKSGLTLDCDHRFCKSCLLVYIKDLIFYNKIAEENFHCPKCSVIISPQMVQGNFSPDVFNKFLESSIKYYEPDTNLFVFKQCVFCYSNMEIPVNKKIITCPGCKKKYCPQCNKNHKGSCFLIDKDFKEVADGIKICPKCKGYIEKIDGCNFVNCPWPGCEKTFFCYLCGKFLNNIEHYSHFFNSGPFGDTCNTIDNISDD